jgi:ribosomal protein S18 acetylase RimI-like enzyme
VDGIPVVRSLVWATGLDVLPPGRVIEEREAYIVIRSPTNPSFYWGNLLLFPDPPAEGDGARWEAAFDAEFRDDRRVRHRTFAWDRTDGVAGAAREEFASRGYVLEETIGLVAEASELRAHARANRDVVVRPLDPQRGMDEELWDAVVDLQVASHDDEDGEWRRFHRSRLEEYRVLFRAGRGAWYVAIDPRTAAVTASCGVVVTGGRGRFQAVDTALAHRRRGICSRLVVEAARRAADTYGADKLVIAADAGYHALGLYESLGFERREHVFGVCLWPTAATGSATVAR